MVTSLFCQLNVMEIIALSQSGGKSCRNQSCEYYWIAMSAMCLVYAFFCQPFFYCTYYVVWRPQLKEEHRLVLRVFDNGEPRLHSDARVTLHVVEDGFFPPDVRNLSIHMNSCTGVIRGVIGQVEAMDRDPYDSLSFSIISPNRHLFDILRDDGRLIVLAGLDEGHYTINVSVTDGKYVTFGMVCRWSITFCC